MASSKLLLGLLFLASCVVSTRAISANQTTTIASVERTLLASLTVKRTRAFALLFSCLQCISDTDDQTAEIRKINKSFKPEQHRNKYKHKKALDRLLQHVRENKKYPNRITEPFTYTPENIRNLQIILDPLYFNADKWGLFYNTSAWLLGRVNNAQLYWALKIVAHELFPSTVVTANAAEVFPQLFIGMKELIKVAPNALSPKKPPTQEKGGDEDDVPNPNGEGETAGGAPDTNGDDEPITQEEHPLYYWMTDPGLNEFRMNWQMDNPYWWKASKYGIKIDRIGELFFYMHHQILARYNAELLSNNLPFVTKLKLDPYEYTSPGSYHPDVVNVNFSPFHSRKDREQMKDLDDGKTLEQLKTWFKRLQEGISKGYLKNEDGTPEFLFFANASNTLGAAVGASSPPINVEYYGTFHNVIHSFLGYLFQGKQKSHKPGVMALVETSMRDPVFYRLHKLIDTLYTSLQARQTPYNGCSFNSRGIQINSVALNTEFDGYQQNPPFIFTTAMVTDTFDISTAARPCGGVGGESAPADVDVLHYDPYQFNITVTSTKPTKTNGIVRIFFLPDVDHFGNKLDTATSEKNAIQMDIFSVILEPNQTTNIFRRAIDSSVIRYHTPGIKDLYTAELPSPNGILNDDMKRACGWPHNLLLPRGTEAGLQFKLYIMITEVTPENVREMPPHFAYCGMLNGLLYPDTESMGFPFDRPLTRTTRTTNYEGMSFGNIIEVPVLIRHRGWR